MLFDSVPGHHNFNNLQTSKNAVSFRFIPKTVAHWDSPPGMKLVWKITLSVLSKPPKFSSDGLG